MIDLGDGKLLGKGNERNCYRHPDDHDLVIKVNRIGHPGRGQNRIEHAYLSSLARRNAPTDHVPRHHGMVPTSFGDGLVVERIAEPDGTASPSLKTVLIRKRIEQAEADALLAALLAHLIDHWIVFADVGDDNLVLQTLPDGTRRLVIIDGLGARHPGFKLWLHSRIPWLARMKTRKQWPKLLANIARRPTA